MLRFRDAALEARFRATLAHRRRTDALLAFLYLSVVIFTLLATHSDSLHLARSACSPGCATAERGDEQPTCAAEDAIFDGAPGALIAEVTLESELHTRPCLIMPYGSMLAWDCHASASAFWRLHQQSCILLSGA